MKKISIIIVTHNSDKLIYDCLSSIFTHNDINNDLEVIIVDNVSNNVDEMFFNIKAEYGDRVILIKNTINGGYGQGNNVGIKASTAPIIMIMNPDVRLISPIFNKVNMHFSDPSVAMLGMRQMVSVEKQGLSFSAPPNNFPILSLFGIKICNIFQIYIQNKMYFLGASFFIRKNIFEEIGLFDENIFMYGEEIDVHYRLNGYYKPIKIKYDKNLKYIHLIDGRPLSDMAFFNDLQSGLYLCEKFNLDKRKYIKNKIILIKLWIIIEQIRGNKRRVIYYKNILNKISSYIISV